MRTREDTDGRPKGLALSGPQAGETLDSICGGAVQVLQRRSGYRFNLDPLLLAHFVMGDERVVRGPLIDLGTGTGIIPLVLVRRFGRSDITGLELQPRLFSLAERNVLLNRCERDISLVLADLRQVEEKFAAGSFAHVVCNPPYGKRSAGRTNPDAERALARHEVACRLEDVLRAADYLLGHRGTLALVHPASRLAELSAELRLHRFAPRRLRMVHPRVDRPAKLVLIHAVKGGRADLSVLPPLFLHPAKGPAFTEEVARILS